MIYPKQYYRQVQEESCCQEEEGGEKEREECCKEVEWNNPEGEGNEVDEVSQGGWS